MTARSIDDAHADYLHAIGFQFNRNRFDLSPLDDENSVDQTGIAPTIFERMVEEQVAERLEAFCPAGAQRSLLRYSRAPRKSPSGMD